MDRLNKPLNIAIINYLITAAEANTAADQLTVIDLFTLGFIFNFISRDKSPDLSVNDIIFGIIGHHSNAGIVISLRQVKPQINPSAVPETAISRNNALSDLCYLHKAFSSKTFVKDIHVLAEEIFTLIFVVDSSLTLFPEIVHDKFMSKCRRISLIKSSVRGLPEVAVFELIVRLIEQRKDFSVSETVKDFFSVVDLLDHGIVIVRILS